MTGVVLSAALLEWSLRTGLGVPNNAPGVIFSPEDGVAPDVVWIGRARLERGLGADGKLHATPNWRSRSSRRGRRTSGATARRS